MPQKDLSSIKQLYSSFVLLNQSQKVVIFIGLNIFIYMFLYHQKFAVNGLYAFINFIYMVTVIGKIRLIASGLKIENSANSIDCQTIADDILPSYAIMVPLYKEARVVNNLIYRLSKLEYPRNLLNIYLILEEDDPETKEVIACLDLPSYFIVIEVPTSYPRTKAKACNYALQYINSELLVIYDAEDIPDLSQLKKVAAKFHYSTPKLACVQCRLNIYNGDETWLSAMFAIEYKILFGYLLPALEQMKAPIPLGGSSNHFNLAILKAIGGWDDFNVTEDAEIGIRLARCGFRTQMANLSTQEEAPLSVTVWLKQRSRWIKGYLQTLISNLRYPKNLINDLTFKEMIWAGYFIGASTIVYLLPLVSLLLYLISRDNLVIYGCHIAVSAITFILGFAVTFYSSYTAKNGMMCPKVLRWWWSYPVYFILHNIAGIRAVYQLITAPHYWDKTPHNGGKID